MLSDGYGRIEMCFSQVSSRNYALSLALVAGLALTGSVRAEGELEEVEIAQLQFRNITVTITTGPYYRLVDTDGTVISSQLTDAELAAQHPELHQQIRMMFASEDADVMIWGGTFPDR